MSEAWARVTWTLCERPLTQQCTVCTSELLDLPHWEYSREEVRLPVGSKFKLIKENHIILNRWISLNKTSRWFEILKTEFQPCHKPWVLDLCVSHLCASLQEEVHTGTVDQRDACIRLERHLPGEWFRGLQKEPLHDSEEFNPVFNILPVSSFAH